MEYTYLYAVYYSMVIKTFVIIIINTMDSLQCPGKFYRKTHPFQEMDVAVVFSV